MAASLGEEEKPDPLKPCPFCGNAGVFFYEHPGCCKPDCAGYNFYEDDARITVDQWNRRAPDPNVARVCESIELQLSDGPCCAAGEAIIRRWLSMLRGEK
jgi:hypothetical protein